MSLKIVPAFSSFSRILTSVSNTTTTVVALKELLLDYFLSRPDPSGEARDVVGGYDSHKTDPMVSNALMRFKEEKTDEAEYSPYRPTKRFHIAEDALLDTTEYASSNEGEKPWGAKYRLTGLPKPIEPAFEQVQPDSMHLSSGMPLELIDYWEDANPKLAKVATGFISSVKVDKSSTSDYPEFDNDPNWATLTNQISNKLVFHKAGRYLLTGKFRVQLGMFNHTEKFPDDYTQIQTVAGSDINSEFSFLTTMEDLLTSNEMDYAFPMYRIKAVHMGVNGSLKTLKNTIFSSIHHHGSSAAPYNCVTVGLCGYLEVEENDEVVLLLERNAAMFEFEDGARLDYDAVFISKKKYSRTYRPSRDKYNYLEITRLNGNIVEDDPTSPPAPPGGPQPPAPGPTQPPAPTEPPAPSPEPTEPEPPVANPDVISTYYTLIKQTPDANMLVTGNGPVGLDCDLTSNSSRDHIAIISNEVSSNQAKSFISSMALKANGIYLASNAINNPVFPGDYNFVTDKSLIPVGDFSATDKLYYILYSYTADPLNINTAPAVIAEITNEYVVGTNAVNSDNFDWNWELNIYFTPSLDFNAYAGPQGDIVYTNTGSLTSPDLTEFSLMSSANIITGNAREVSIYLNNELLGKHTFTTSDIPAARNMAVGYDFTQMLRTSLRIQSSLFTTV